MQVNGQDIGRRYPEPMRTAHLYSAGREVSLDSPYEVVQRLRDDDGDYGWIDITMEDEDELKRLAQLLDLHELAVEDALSTTERPKLARFSTHLLLTLSSSQLLEDGDVELQRLTAFILPNLVITVRDDDFPIAELERRLAANDDLIEHGVSFILWGILDLVVDDHVETLEDLDDLTEELAVELFGGEADSVEVQRRAFGLRRSVVRMHHVTQPLREVVNTLMRRDISVSVRGLEPYFSDVYDHTIHTSEWADAIRDQISMVIETNVAMQGNHMNLTMKKVTSWAAIIAVPTLVTGYFGQNLEFPGFGSVEMWWGSNVIIVLLSVGLFFAFKKFDWL